MSVYSISFGLNSSEKVKDLIEEILNESKAIRFNENCWFLDTGLSQKEVLNTLDYIAEPDEPFCAVIQLSFSDWIQKLDVPEVIKWLNNPLRKWGKMQNDQPI